MSDKNPGEKPVRPTPEELEQAIEGARRALEEDAYCIVPPAIYTDLADLDEAPEEEQAA